MTTMELRALALVELAQTHRDIELPPTPLTTLLRGYLPAIPEPTNCIHWLRICELVAEAHDIRTAAVDESHPVLSRLSRGERPEKADELADELLDDAREEARSCVLTSDARAAGRYPTGSAA